MDQDTIRPAAVAGTFYPDEPEELREMINGFLEAASDIKIRGKLRGLVVPHAGYIYSGPVAAFGYKLLKKYAKKVKKVIILGPSHYARFRGIVESGMGIWETPLGRITLKSIAEQTGDHMVSEYAEAHLPEHSLEVQIPFIQITLKQDVEIYTALTGEAEPKQIAETIEKMIDSETIVIASSDLSHYHPYLKAKEIDENANKYIPKLDIEKSEKALDACGRTGILALMYLAKKKKWKGKFLDYRNSGDTAGDKIRVVGYGCYAFYD